MLTCVLFQLVPGVKSVKKCITPFLVVTLTCWQSCSRNLFRCRQTCAPSPGAGPSWQKTITPWKSFRNIKRFWWKSFLGLGEYYLAMVGKKSLQRGHVSCSSLLGSCRLWTSCDKPSDIFCKMWLGLSKFQMSERSKTVTWQWATIFEWKVNIMVQRWQGIGWASSRWVWVSSDRVSSGKASLREVCK